VRDQIVQSILQSNLHLLGKADIVESLTPEDLKKLSSLEGTSTKRAAEYKKFIAYVYAYNEKKAFTTPYDSEKKIAKDPDSATLSMLDYLLGTFPHLETRYREQLNKLSVLAQHESSHFTGRENIAQYASLLTTMRQKDAETQSVVYPSLAKVVSNTSEYNDIFPKTLDSLPTEALHHFLMHPNRYPSLKEEWKDLSQQQFDDLIKKSFFNDGKILFDKILSASLMARIIGSVYADHFGKALENTSQNIDLLYNEKVRDKAHGNTPIDTALFFAKHLGEKQLVQYSMTGQIIREAKNSHDYQKLMEIFFQAESNKANLCIQGFLEKAPLEKVFAVLAYFEKIEANRNSLLDENSEKNYYNKKMVAINSLIHLFKNFPVLVMQPLLTERPALKENGLSKEGLTHLVNIIGFLIKVRRYDLANDLYEQLCRVFEKNSDSGKPLDIPLSHLKQTLASVTAISPAISEENKILAIYLEAILLNASKGEVEHSFLLSSVQQDTMEQIMPVYKKVLDSTVAYTWKATLEAESLARKTAFQILLGQLLDKINSHPKVRTQWNASRGSLVSDFEVAFYDESSEDYSLSLFQLSQYAWFCTRVRHIVDLLQLKLIRPDDIARIEEDVKELKGLLESLNIYTRQRAKVDVISLVVEISLFNQEEIVKSLDAVESQIKEKEEIYKQELITALDNLEKYTSKKDIVRRTERHRTERLAHIEKIWRAAEVDDNEPSFNELRDNTPQVKIMGQTFGTYSTYLSALDYKTWNYFKSDSEVKDLIGKILGKQDEIKEKQRERDIAEVVIFINTQLSKLDAQLTRQEKATKISVSEAGIGKEISVFREGLLAAPELAGVFFNKEAKADKLATTWNANRDKIKELTIIEATLAELEQRSQALITRAQAARMEQIRQRKVNSLEMYINILGYFEKVSRGIKKISSEDFEARVQWFTGLKKIWQTSSGSQRLQKINGHSATLPDLGTWSELAEYLELLTTTAVHEDWSDEQVATLEFSAKQALEKLKEREKETARLAEKPRQEKAAQEQQRAESDAVDYTWKTISRLESTLDKSSEKLAMDITDLQRQVKQLAIYFKISPNPEAEGISPADDDSNKSSSSWTSVTPTSWLAKKVVTPAMLTHRAVICENEDMISAVKQLQTKVDAVALAQCPKLSAQGSKADELYEGSNSFFGL